MYLHGKPLYLKSFNGYIITTLNSLLLLSRLSISLFQLGILLSQTSFSLNFFLPIISHFISPFLFTYVHALPLYLKTIQWVHYHHLKFAPSNLKSTSFPPNLGYFVSDNNLSFSFLYLPIYLHRLNLFSSSLFLSSGD